MRTLRVFESISVDSYFADSAGNLDWAHSCPEDPQFSAWVRGNARSGAELLFGRKTYQMMESFWPTPLAAQMMPDVATGMNAAKKYLLSSTIRPAWNNTQLIEGGAVKFITELKQTKGPDITVLGSGSVVELLSEAGLIDEYQFVIIPIALGDGRTVFTKRCALRLVESRAFPCGRIAVTYATS